MKPSRQTAAWQTAIPAALALAAGGCVYDRSILAPASDSAGLLAALGWPVFVGFTVVTAVMWGLLAWVAWRRTGTLAEHAPADSGGGRWWVLLGGFLVPVATFAVIFVAALQTMAAVPMPMTERPPDVRVIGHQWWWEIEYLYGELPEHFASANELHIPVGRPVEIELQSVDVIHSLWVPRLGGKTDLVPGQTGRMRLMADRAGEYPGACSELCGAQHANMKIVVVAHEPDEFERWLAHERSPGAEPETAAEERGRELFEHRACVACHTVRGSTALATVGPDLTHVGRRRRIGTSLPNQTATLHAWIVNAPSLKPGVRMPALPEFRGDELHDLVAYLEHLQ